LETILQSILIICVLIVHWLEVKIKNRGLFSTVYCTCILLKAFVKTM
jgi:hypothetical protein